MNMKNKLLSNIPFIIILIILLGAFLYRMSGTVGMADEVFNITIANQIAQGERPFVDCWDLYQTGALFLAPFLAVYKLITGSTDGIILFSRYVYLLFNMAAAYLIYLNFRKIIGVKPAVLAGIFSLTYTPFSMYYPWYDTVELMFMLIGILLLTLGIQTEKERHKRIMFMCAGFCHACMCISHPYFVGTAMILFICTVVYALCTDKKIRMPLFYAAGAGIVIVVALIYVLSVGFENIFIFDNEKVAVITDRNITQNAEWVISLIKRDYEAFIREMKPTFRLQCIPLAVYAANRFLKKYPLYILTYILILICAYHTSFLRTYTSMIFIFTVAAWAPVLLWDIPKEKRKQMLYPLLFSGAATIAAYFMVSVNLMGTDIKGLYVALPAAVITVICMAISLIYNPVFSGKNKSDDDAESNASSSIVVFVRNNEKQIKIASACLVIIIAAICNIKNYYRIVYPVGSAPFENYTVRQSDGIYKGILLTEKEANEIDNYKSAIDSVVKESDETMLILDPYRMQGYMISDLRPAAPAIWDIYANDKIDGIKLYFDEVSGEPDLIVWGHNDANFIPEMKTFVDMKYREEYNDDYVVIYRKK